MKSILSKAFIAAVVAACFTLNTQASSLNHAAIADTGKMAKMDKMDKMKKSDKKMSKKKMGKMKKDSTGKM